MATNLPVVSHPESEARALINLMAETLQGVYLVKGHFVRIKADVDTTGKITTLVTPVCFDGPDHSWEILLAPTAPVLVNH